MRRLAFLSLRHDQDVVAARQRAAQIAALLGFDTSEATKIATAVSEIVRNAFRYGRSGEVAFDVDGESRPQRLVVTVSDRGPGIPHLEDVLSGRYRSTTGMGMGIVGARRLMDGFSIESTPAGTTVILDRHLPARAPLLTGERADDVARAVERRGPRGLVEEIQEQNQALLRALDELQRKQEELVQLNRELEDTNRGVVALYAELDEKADYLRRADELKSRFLSNMTHEFRTPVNAIIGLCNLLVDDRHRDGREPEPELQYIRKAADQLSELVNDLLDLAKVEAGKSVVRPAAFEVDQLFGALRGMLRPLLLNQSVSLVFDGPEGLPVLFTDEGKVSQILRNLISNALKFTERGEVRVSARAGDAGEITFAVMDTGIGIAPADQQRIFEEFTQLEHRLQRGVRGTGLGLALSRRLAELLGGSLTVESEVGAGSTFRVTVPVQYRPPGVPEVPFEWRPVEGMLPVLVIEDAPDAQYLYERILKGSAFQMYPARTEADAMRALEDVRPEAVVLDIVLQGGESWDLLVRLRRDRRTADVPIIVVSTLPERNKGLALGADAYLLKPIDRRMLLDTLSGLHARRQPPMRVLTIDDEEVARFLVRQCLPAPAFDVIEASTPEEGLRRAAAEQPDVILLDLVMPRLTGEEVLARLQAEEATAGIPVIFVSSMGPESDERRTLHARGVRLMEKRELTRESLPAAVRAARRGRGTTL